MLASLAPKHRWLHSPGLARMPETDEQHFRYETFQVDGLDSIDVLRPAERCYYPERDDAPALVLVPGLGMDCRGYIRQFPLGSLTEIHCPQATNRAIAGEEGLGHFARHVEEYILDRKLDQRPGGFFLGGSSMGGAVSLTICARGRVKPRGLILLGTFAHCKHLPLYQRVLAPLSWYLPLDWMKRSVRPFLARVKRVGDMSGGEAMFITSARSWRTREYYGTAIMALTCQDQLDAARAINVPTLVVHGTNDWVLPHAAGEELARIIPGARFVSVKGGGHGFFFTHAEITNSACAQFINDVCGS